MIRQTYGKLLPGLEPAQLSGKLIVIEGTDGAGRTTQINLLKPWLEEQGHAVLDTGMARSSLAGDGIRRAKEGNNLGRVTQSLFYATDFVDRLENEIVPALRAGFIVLTDRYIYSLMARAIVRGVDPQWVRKLYRMALKPEAVLYLRLEVEQLIPRVVFSRGFDYWESGMDYYPARDMHEGFCNYQKALLAEFDRLSAEYKFEVVDASADPKTVFAILKARVLRLLEPGLLEPQPTATPVASPAVSAVVSPLIGEAAAPRPAVHLGMSEAELESLLARVAALVAQRNRDFFKHAAPSRTPFEATAFEPNSFEPNPASRPKREDGVDLKYLESLFERASLLASLRRRIPEPPPNWEEVFELNLPPIESQINQAFELATQALAAGSQLGQSPAHIGVNRHSNGVNGHSNGNGHANGH